MKLLGLNSPEIFIILVIILVILGPGRIESGLKLLQNFLKYLLSDDKNTSLGLTDKLKAEEIKEEVKAEEIKEEVKAEKKSEKQKSRKTKVKKIND